MKKGVLELGARPTEADLEKHLPLLPRALPESYVDFLKNHDGAGGDLPVQPFYFHLWRLGEAVENNRDYEVQNYLPGYFGIGGNGGGEMLAFDLQNGKIFAVPFVPMNEQDALLVAESFEEFEDMMGLTDGAR